MEREIRPFEVRAITDEGPPRLVGYAARFNVQSHYLGFYETIRPGAFTRTLASNPDVRANVQHEGGLFTIGRTTNGTLRLEQDDIGLKVEIFPPDTQAGRDTLTLTGRGDMNEMSFAFQIPKGGDKWTQQGGEHYRELLDIELDGGDVAVVTGPAYPQTTVEVRALIAGSSEGGELAENNDADAVSTEARLDLQKRKIQLERLK